MKEVTKELNKRTGRINRHFGGRYKGCLIENARYLLNVYKYICRNPVAAGIVEKAEQYPYSTFHYHEKKEMLPIELDKIMPMNIAVSRVVEIEWVNSTFDELEAESVRWGLQRTKFKYKSRDMKMAVVPKLEELEIFYKP